MHILITGGAGYIGSHVAHRLVGLGESVTVVDNLSSGFQWAIPDRAQFINIDLQDSQAVAGLSNLGKFDAIMHFAAYTQVGESVIDPLRYYRNNTAVTLSLAELAVNAKISKFIFSSTAAVYGNSPAHLVSETDLPKPVNPYGASKLMSERILLDTALSSNG